MEKPTANLLVCSKSHLTAKKWATNGFYLSWMSDLLKKKPQKTPKKTASSPRLEEWFSKRNRFSYETQSAVGVPWFCVMRTTVRNLSRRVFVFTDEASNQHVRKKRMPETLLILCVWVVNLIGISVSSPALHGDHKLFNPCLGWHFFMEWDKFLYVKGPCPFPALNKSQFRNLTWENFKWGFQIDTKFQLNHSI